MAAAAGASPEAFVTEAERADPPPNRLRVLVVEDDPVAREALARLLAGQGHEPLTAEDGNQAAERARVARPDLLIVDYRLPDTTGLEVVAVVAATRTPPPVAILVTGHGLSQTVRARAQALGVKVLGKPVVPRRLFQIVEEARRFLAHARGAS